MSKYAVAVFPNETVAYEGVGAFNSLHAEGNLSLYALAVIAKDADGNASVMEEQDEGQPGGNKGYGTSEPERSAVQRQQKRSFSWIMS